MSYYKHIGEEITVDFPELTNAPAKGIVIDVIDQIICPGEGTLDYIVRFKQHIIRMSTMYEVEIDLDNDTVELLSRTPYKLERIIL